MKTDVVNRLRVASPCPISWEQMAGNDRVRFCQVCDLNVYNIAELTRKEATALVSDTEGRICARLFRRSDGTVITRDCPVGLRAIRRRVARTTGAIFATVVALSSAVFGQKPAKKDSSCKQQVTISRKQSDAEAGVVTGTILDVQGAIVVGGRIKLIDQKSKSSVDATSDEKGYFRIAVSGPGAYEVMAEVPGFKKLRIADLTIASHETITLAMILTPDNADITVLVGVIGDDPLIDISKPSGTTIMSGDMIRRLPIPR